MNTSCTARRWQLTRHLLFVKISYDESSRNGMMDMKRVRITVMRQARYDDLIAQYENPLEHACDMRVGQTFVSENWQKPAGFCDSAWDTISPFVMALAHGAGDFYDGWMKNKHSAMLSCNDGFRPVSFLLETLE